jgi:uncharacterized protein (TIGR02246 family)
MMISRCVAVLSVLMVGFTASGGTEFCALAGESPQNPKELLQILDDEGAAWAKGDADAFAAHVRDNVAFTNIVGMFSLGKTPFVAQHKSIFASIYKDSTVRQFVQNISFIRYDTAIVDTITKVVNFHELPPGVSAVDGALYTRLEQVMVKEHGTWKVASFHNVAIAPKFVDQSVRTLTGSDGH